MSTKITQIKEVAEELDTVVADEQEIIKKLVDVSGGHLAGKFNCSENDGYRSWLNFRIKIKIKGLHILLSSSGDVDIWSVTCKIPYKGADKIFRNHRIATGWKACRGHITLEELVSAVLGELKFKRGQADKENRELLNKEITTLNRD